MVSGDAKDLGGNNASGGVGGGVTVGDDASQEQSAQSHDPRLDVWKPEHTVILSEWADKAMCYQWLHFKSHIKFNRLSHLYTIPVIIISTLTGTANFATGKINWPYTSVVIGAFNIGAGIITTIQHFLKINELTEGHRFASLAWDKFYRNIKVELSKSPVDRVSAYHMLKLYKEEYDRLMETSPIIGDDIIALFRQSFLKSEMFNDVKKPEIIADLVPTLFSVYKEPPPDPNAPLVEEPKTPDAEKIRTEMIVAKFRENNMKSLRDKKLLADFIEDFQKLHSRRPGEDEIINNLKDKIDVETLKKLVRAPIVTLPPV